MRRFIAGIALTLTALSVAAQVYPNKTIRMVLPYPAGGGTDALGRIMAERLADRLGVAVVVNNVPGGSGTVGSDQVRRSEPDGSRSCSTPACS